MATRLFVRLPTWLLEVNGHRATVVDLRVAGISRTMRPRCQGDRIGALCGPFAVPRAGNSREQARTADHEPQCFRGFSRVFPAVPGL